MPSSKAVRLEASGAHGDLPATVSVWQSRTGAVFLGMQPWALTVRFTPEQLGALVEHLSALRNES